MKDVLSTHALIRSQPARLRALAGALAVLGVLEVASCSGGAARTSKDGGVAPDSSAGSSVCSLGSGDATTVDASYTLSDKRHLTLHGVSSFQPASSTSSVAIDVALDGAVFWRSTVVRSGTSTSVTVTRDAAFSGSQSETLFTTDGHTWSGTIDGRALAPFEANSVDVADPLRGVSFVSGEAIETKRVDSALAAGLTALFAAARSSSNGCASAGLVDAGASSASGADGGSLFMAPSPEDHGHASDPRSSAGCIGLLAGCTATQSACIWAGVPPCAAFLVGAAVCEAIVTASCVAGGITCAVTVLNGGVCCPVACGSSSCCERGESCLNAGGACCGPSQQGCHGVTCCDQLDTCMPDATCCPAPPDGEVCANGNICCTGGTHCMGGICCPAGMTNVAGQCCPVGQACGGVCCDTVSTCVDPAHSVCCAGLTGVPCGTSCCDATKEKCIGGACCPTGLACGSVCCAGGLTCADPKIGACSLPPSSCSPNQSGCLSVQILSPLPNSIQIGINGGGSVTLAASASPIQTGSTASFVYSWYPTALGPSSKQIIIAGDSSETWDLAKSGICSASASSMEDVTIEAYAEDSTLDPTFTVLSSGSATVNVHIICEILR